MSQLEDAIAEIIDPKVRARVDRAVAELKASRRYGLVFENHFSSEMVVLPGLPIRVGAAVTLRTEPANGVRYFEVVRIEAEEAVLIPAGGGEERVVPQSDLLVVKPFEEPIYPGLTRLDGVARGGSDKPAHMVWNAENFHALQLLLFTHLGKVDLIYIDPPYNTGERTWKYNNRFVDDNDTWRHSKWLSMMEKRLKLAGKLLKPDGVLVVTIDEHEVHRLGVLLEQLFEDAYHQMVTIVNNPKGVTQERYSRVEEYALFTFFGDARIGSNPDDLLTWGGERAGDPGAAPRWKGLLRSGKEAKASDRPNMCYPVLVKTETKAIVGTGPSLEERAAAGEIEDSSWDDFVPPKSSPDDEVFEAWPIRRDKSLGRWFLKRSELAARLELGYVRAGGFDSKRNTIAVSYLSDEKIQQIESGLLEVMERDPITSVVDVRYVDVTTRRQKTVWHRSAHDAGVGGTDLLSALVGETGFDYPKSVYAVRDTLAGTLLAKPDAVVLDFFAGSGTTLHATAMLNAQDGGTRQCILVTNNELSEGDAKALNQKGKFHGDSEFEAAGVFESVARPRTKAAIMGVRPDGQPPEGKYLSTYLDNHAYADGFEESVEFFRMDYLDPDVVSLGRQYDAIAPLLWAASGSIGEWESRDGDEPWSAPKTSTYAILFEEDAFVEFRSFLKDRPDITHAWLVTNSPLSFADMKSELSDDIAVGMLYRDYLRNFEINTAEALR